MLIVDLGRVKRSIPAIDPSVLPRMPRKVRIRRKVGYAIAFPVRNQQIKATYDKVNTSKPTEAISHTTDPFTKQTVLFSGIEVKQSNGGNTEALLQLTICLVAGLGKLLHLSHLSNKPLNGGQLLPGIGWTVIGHDWYLYVAFRETFDGQDRIVRKPLPVLLWLQANSLVH